MSKESPDKEFLNGIRETLDASVDNLDEQTLLRLRRIRLDVLESAVKRRRLFGMPRWVTAGGFATVAVVAVTISIWLTSSQQRLPVRHVEEVEILTTQEHLELYKDLDFYRWLSDAETKGKER